MTTSTKPSPQAMCAAAPGPFNASAGPMWNGWGVNGANTRYQDAATAGIAAGGAAVASATGAVTDGPAAGVAATAANEFAAEMGNALKRVEAG